MRYRQSKPAAVTKIIENRGGDHPLRKVLSRMGILKAVAKFVRRNDLFWRIKFQDLSAHRIFGAVRPGHYIHRPAADLEIHRLHLRIKTSRPPPLLDVLGFGPDLPDQISRCVKFPNDHQVFFRYFRFTRCRHLLSSSLKSPRYSSRRPMVCLSPSTAPNFSTVRSRSSFVGNSICHASLVLSLPSSSNVILT